MTVAAPQQDSNQLAPGYRLDRYELLCPIAEGGMASVWVARQRGKHGFEKLVAIKTILPKFAADNRFQQMFLDEARIASRIEHAHVAQILDLGEDGDILYLAMEYVDGDALSKLNRACQRKGVTFPTGVLLRVLADTCAGLHEAHELKDPAGKLLGIVHRDVSPHNILVSAKGAAKLIDFGIAKAQSRVGADTVSGVVKGKVQYMAPEQALGHNVDRRADLWAIGAILYHMLAGRPPYEGDTQLATLNLLGSGRPPMPLPEVVHPAIRAVVRRALSHAVDKRYATAAELRDALEEVMVTAAVTTTEADVAAFATAHLADRADRRRHLIEAALAAAAERQAKDESTTRPSGGFPASSRPGQSQTPSSSHVPLPSVPSSSLAVTPAAGPGGAPPVAALLTPRLSEPPTPGSHSYATLGSAALDASGTQTRPAQRSRKGIFVVAGLVAVVAAAASIGSVVILRPKAASDGAAVAAAPPAAPPTPPSATAPVVNVAPPPSASPPPGPTTIPTFQAGALPRANVATPRWTPPPQVAPRPPPPKKGGAPDDGF